MSLKNRFKNDIDSSKSSAGEEKAKSAKSSKAKKEKNQKATNKKSLLKDQRTKNLVGLAFLFISAILMLALTSHLFTGNADQSILSTPLSDFEDEREIRNWLGTFGAHISQKLVSDWFGVASFSFVLLSFLIGFRILFGFFLLPFKQVLKYTIFTLLWLPAFLGFFFTSSHLLLLSGGVGQTINTWLSIAMGNVGALLFIIFSAIAFIAVNFKVSFAKIAQFFGSEKELDEREESSFYKKEEFEKREQHVQELADEEDDDENEESLQSEPEPTIIEDDEKQEIDLSEPEENEPDDEVDQEDENSEELEVDVNQDEEQADSGSDREEEKEEKTDEDDVEIEIEQSEEDEELSDRDVNKKVKDFGEYDPTLDLSKFKLPTIELLDDHGGGEIKVNREELEENKNKIVDTLKNYKIGIDKIKATVGPTVTLYEIVPEAGVRISKIKNLEDDIALSLSALGIRIIAPIPGRGTIGIEVPNQDPDIVSMRSLIKSDKFQNSKYALPIALGKTVSNETFIADLAKMPHLLLAGATGQGKSVGLNAILVSLLYRLHPSQIKFVLVDPKKVELTLFNKIERHYLAKLPDTEEAIITDNSQVINTLNSLCIEMDKRYELLKDAMVRNVKEYNNKFINRKLNPENGHRYMPYIVLVVDEFADLIMTAGKEVETPIARLAQLARAVGIHLIIATQRPSVNVITGLIKANFPARIAFRVTSKVDSRTILDSGGADQLIGRGDMLLSQGSDLLRLQCGFVDTPEVEEICDYIGNQQGYPDAMHLPEYSDDSAGGGAAGGGGDISDRDALFEDSAQIIVQTQQGSASLLQRKLKIGYNRAGRIIDQLEEAGIIGPFEGSKARQVLIPDEYALEQLLNSESEND
ncbi:MAG: DNA translocase FtsK [Salibacter sp.]|uniref:FtsK/SpoIIIE family DNA translocase n=1 Tax=Salibacter sp. TaxID=2010995 RepID=UPI00287013A3|nr:DNA translocase FtsK [Salibacter sp.]MDR9399092.1 DNA translocase FtsK [Salibacter sp.]